MKKRTREDILNEIALIQTIRERLMKGEKVKCSKCNEYLIFLDKDSGKHPGVFCPNGDFEILIEYK